MNWQPHYCEEVVGPLESDRTITTTWTRHWIFGTLVWDRTYINKPKVPE